jgi:hypothetical protein
MWLASLFTLLACKVTGIIIEHVQGIAVKAL